MRPDKEYLAAIGTMIILGITSIILIIKLWQEI